jgi:hypothetical protein
LRIFRTIEDNNCIRADWTQVALENCKFFCLWSTNTICIIQIKFPLIRNLLRW